MDHSFGIVSVTGVVLWIGIVWVSEWITVAALSISTEKHDKYFLLDVDEKNDYNHIVIIE